MNPHINHVFHSLPRSLRGLSLIELMVSITIGLLILVSLTSMFVSQTRARTELDKANRMIENGRYALEMLSSNLRTAGFFAGYAPSGTPASIYDPCSTSALITASSNIDILRVPVQGYDAATSSAQIASPPCSLTYTTGTALTLKPGSDILAMRRVNTAAASTQASALYNGTIFMQVSSCEHDTTPYLISTIKDNLHLGQRNITGTDNCRSTLGSYTPAAPYADVRPFISEVYFVSPHNNIINGVPDGIPTLKRRELTSSSNNPVFVTTPLVEGIEFMQVEYGIDNPALDTDGIGGAGLDGAPDYYSSCSACTNEEWSNVVAVKLHLIARNIETTSGYSDTKTYELGSGTADNYTPSGANVHYKRHAYTQLVRMINVSGRREVP